MVHNMEHPYMVTLSLTPLHHMEHPCMVTTFDLFDLDWTIV